MLRQQSQCASLAAVASFITIIIYTIGSRRASKQGISFQKSIVMVFNETTNDFIQSSKACQYHLESRAANVWDLVQIGQSPIQWNRACPCWCFYGELSSD